MEPGISNQSFIFSYTDFTLLGFPGISRWRPLLAIPFFSVYLVILSGNSLIIHLIYTEKTLHSPMYLLISVLFAINITVSTAILPKFLLDLLFRLNQVSLTGCLLQMFSIYFMSVCESGVMLLMSLDRYVAICRPLRYHNIMTKRFLLSLTFIVIIRSFILVCPFVLFTSMVQFCRSNIILNFTCENMALLSLGCGDTTKPQIAGLIVRIIVTALDGSLFFLSYSTILYTAMKTVDNKSRHKALNTCGTHLLVTMQVYVSGLVSSLIARGKALHKALHTCSTHLIVVVLNSSCGLIAAILYRMPISVDVQNLFSAIYYLFPATIHPIIYGYRMKEIRRCLVNGKRHRNVPTQDLMVLVELPARYCLDLVA
uniref:Olfactory receptor n=1 Tax=Xenopus tropicalis TaxID=8364 RepID=A0A803JS86_XENTR